MAKKSIKKTAKAKKKNNQEPKDFECRNNSPPISFLDQTPDEEILPFPVDKSPKRL